MVDDYDDALVMMTALLESQGAEVRCASSADEALACVRSMLPHVLISDIAMPAKDGVQLLREVRLLPISEGGATPAMAVTGFGSSQDRARTKLAGYEVHLTKPLDLAEVVAAVRLLAHGADGDAVARRRAPSEPPAP